MSPILAESLVFPKAPENPKVTRVYMIDTVPDHLTSTESIRKFSLKHLEKVKSFAEKEKKAKVIFLKKAETSSKKCAKGKVVTQSKSKKGKRPSTEKEKLEQVGNDLQEVRKCEACHMTWEEDQGIQLERIWVQCDVCDRWKHSDCLSYDFDENEPFLCPKCCKN